MNRRYHNPRYISKKNKKLLIENNIRNNYGKLLCTYCKCNLHNNPGYNNSMEFDHIYPLSSCRYYELEKYSNIINIVICCRKCNRSKGKKTFEEWKGKNASFDYPMYEEY